MHWFDGKIIFSEIASSSTLISREVATSSCKSQCGNCRIFQSLKFYMKSKLATLEMQNLPFFHIDSLWLDFMIFFTFYKADIYQNSEPLKWQNCSFETSRFSDIDFTKNLIVSQFPSSVGLVVEEFYNFHTVCLLFLPGKEAFLCCSLFGGLLLFLTKSCVEL